MDELKVLLPLPALIAMGFVAYGCLGLFREWKCLVQVVRETQVAGTNWVAQTRGIFCGFGVGGFTDIRVVKSGGYSTRVIAKGDNVDLAVVDGSAPNHLRITLPADKDIEVHEVKIPGLSLEFTYK